MSRRRVKRAVEKWRYFERLTPNEEKMVKRWHRKYLRCWSEYFGTVIEEARAKEE